MSAEADDFPVARIYSLTELCSLYPCRRRARTMTTSRSSISKTSSSRAQSSSASATAKPARSSVSSAVSHSMTSKQKPLSKLVPPEGLSSSPYTSTRSFGHGPKLLVIESIPMWSCPHCGESYFTAQTIHEIERIKALRKSVALARLVMCRSLFSQAMCPTRRSTGHGKKQRAGELGTVGPASSAQTIMVPCVLNGIARRPSETSESTVCPSKKPLLLSMTRLLSP